MRKFLIFHTPSTGHHQFPPPFQPKGKNKDMRKKEKNESHIRSRKQNKEKNWKKVEIKQIS